MYVLSVSVCGYACVCVCVCLREREKGREVERERELEQVDMCINCISVQLGNWCVV